MPDYDPTPEKTILIIEKDEAIGVLLTLAIWQETDHHPVLASTLQAAMNAARQIRPGLCIVNNHEFVEAEPSLPALQQTLDELGGIPTILLTTNAMNPSHLFPKGVVVELPFELKTLLETINSLLSSY